MSQEQRNDTSNLYNVCSKIYLQVKVR